MPAPIHPQTTFSEPLRLYPSRWPGPVLLVCRKCEKKLKRSTDFPQLKVKKSLKRLARADSTPQPLHVLAVGCMKLCPKGAVAVCPPAQLAQSHPGLSILRSKQDIAALYTQYKRL